VRFFMSGVWGAFLETDSLDPPPAALRLFLRTIEILSFQT